MKRKVVLLASLLLVLGLIYGCNADIKETKNPVKKARNTQELQKDEPKYTFANGIATLEDIKIEITDTKVIPVGEKCNEYGEKPVIAFWYKVTNITGKEIDPLLAWEAVFTAYQDTDKNQENILEAGSLPDEKYIDSQSENIKKGGTAECAVAYELDDKTTPVVLKATKGIGGEKLGEQEYEIK